MSREIQKLKLKSVEVLNGPTSYLYMGLDKETKQLFVPFTGDIDFYVAILDSAEIISWVEGQSNIVLVDANWYSRYLNETENEVLENRILKLILQAHNGAFDEIVSPVEVESNIEAE